MSGWSLVAASLVVLAVGTTLVVLRRVAGEAQQTVEALREPRPASVRVDSSKVLARAEHLAQRRRPATGPQRPPR
ncbi:hypothetical protein B7486_63130 [cyanobacterium TDX16]|nr:hypothetical protein B7486_63130 [cyanobacterium TDX16]